MATDLLAPGAVSVMANTQGMASELVGSPPQWADSSDASYSKTWVSRRSSASSFPSAYANISAFTGDPAAATAVSLSVRGDTANSGGATLRNSIFTLYTSGWSYLGQWMNDPAYPYDMVVAWPATAGPHDLTVTDFRDGNRNPVDPVTLAGYLAAGVLIECRRQSVPGDTIPGDYALTVYELSISVTYGQAAAVKYLRPCRRFPRG